MRQPFFILYKKQNLTYYLETKLYAIFLFNFDKLLKGAKFFAL